MTRAGRGAAIAVAVASLATAAALGIAAAGGPAPPRSMDDRVHQVASTLRCPVCQDLSVADSPSLVAQQIRGAIARRLEAGQTPAEIRDYFVSRFGESILLAPPGHGIDLVAWALPAILVAMGLGVLVLAMGRWARRTGRPPEVPALSVPDRDALARELRTLDGEAT